MNIEFLLPLALPVAASFVVGLASSFLPKILDNKYTPIVLRVFEVLDPILADNTKIYGESGVRTLIKETIKFVADRRLSQDEVNKILDLALKLFRPDIAAGKPITTDTQTVVEAITRTDGNLGSLDLSGLRWKFPVG